jgi:hypothetical protein
MELQYVNARLDVVEEALRPHGARATCGCVAGAMFKLLTGKTVGSLDDAVRKRRFFMPKDAEAAIAPVPKGFVRVLSLSAGNENHDMTFVMTPCGQVYTVQSFHPFICRVRRWAIPQGAFHQALRVVAKATYKGREWDEGYAAAFVALSDVTCKRCSMDERTTAAGKDWISSHFAADRYPAKRTPMFMFCVHTVRV